VVSRRRHRHRRRIALLALFIALGGTAYAATGFPANIIGAKQLKKNAVTAPKIKNGAVTGAKIKDDSITGADILESSLGRVPSAVLADVAANATSATTATSAIHATTASNADNATNADKLGGDPPSSYQRQANGTCPPGRGINALGADGSITCATQVFPVSFNVASPGVNDPADALPFLHIGAGCDLPATFVSIINTGPTAATLNWIYSNGTSVSSSGTSLGTTSPANELDISFDNARIEGQFVFANGNGVTTISLHAFDAEPGGCDVRGTMDFSG